MCSSQIVVLWASEESSSGSRSYSSGDSSSSQGSSEERAEESAGATILGWDIVVVDRGMRLGKRYKRMDNLPS